MSINETFSNTILFPANNESDKGAVMQISTLLGTFTILLLEASSETGLFGHLPDYDFVVRNSANTKPMRAIFFFKIFKT